LEDIKENFEECLKRKTSICPSHFTGHWLRVKTKGMISKREKICMEFHTISTLQL
jgi:hypothetical protein